MFYMNAKNERWSDSDNFGVRITEFSVVVEKIWRLGRGDGAIWEAAGLCLAARREEEEGGWGLAVRERWGRGASGSGVGMWARWCGPAVGQGWRSGQASWARKEKKNEIH
jgi:hypothetical protein